MVHYVAAVLMLACVMNSKQMISAQLKISAKEASTMIVKKIVGVVVEQSNTRLRHPRGGLIGALMFFVLTFAIPVNAQTIYQEKMLRLNAENNSASKVETLANYQGKILLTSFFMPNCRWCQRQHRVLKKMQDSCPNLQTVMLGVQGSKQKLRHELQREKNTFPAYLANKNIINAIGSQSPVPMMLIFDNQGQLAFKTIGYTPEEKLKTLLNQHQIRICNA